MNTTYTFSRAVVAAGAESRVDLLIDFQDAQEKPPRRPLNLSLVLDRSGSMAGKSLKQAIRAAKMLVDRLTAEDTLSVVTYDDTIKTIWKPTRVEDKGAVKAALDAVRAGGLTNLSGGWQEGCENVSSTLLKGGVNRVLLLTDGQANQGITNQGQLVKLVQEQASKGVATTTLGFGSYFNEDLLIAMADAGAGNFYFIQSPTDAAEVFNIEVEGLAAVAAQKLQVALQPAEGVEIVSVLNAFPTSRDGRKVSVTVGDVYANEGAQLVLELALSGLAAGMAAIAKAETSWETLDGDSVTQHSGAFDVEITAGSEEEAAAAPLDQKVVKQADGLRIGRAKEEAVELADKGDLKAASARLRQVASDLKIQSIESFEVAEEIDQLEHYATLFEKGRYGTSYRKEIKDQSYQARNRNRGDLKLRGLSSGSTEGLDAVTAKEGEEPEGVLLTCVRVGGKLRMRVVSDGYDADKNVQFPRALRQEGCRYLVESIEEAGGGSFYRAKGDIKLMLRPGESRPSIGGSSGRRNLQKAKVKTAADLETTDDVGDGIVIQCVPQGSKLRARVVSDGYDPDKNVRFPRSIRQVGVLYVTDEVRLSSNGKNYEAYGTIKRLIQ